jgi:histidinol-phosphate aminotransferase
MNENSLIADLDHHGDAELAPGLIDCATNVRLPGPPDWLRERLVGALSGLGTYPTTEQARVAIAERHRRPPEDVLVTSGATETFFLVARALGHRRAVCVHPSFTAPEAALWAAGHAVQRILLASPFTLDPSSVPDEADLVVLGNPTNPTSVLHPVSALEALVRPGRIVVVDESFADCVPAEQGSLAGRRDLPGLLVVRSLTKTWGLAGLRIGYLLAEPALVRQLALAQPPWSVSTLAAVAAEACSSTAALAEADAWARALAPERERFARELASLPGVGLVPGASASFLLLHVDRASLVRDRLRTLGVAVRRGDTFPGLGSDWLRVSVRDRKTNERVFAAFRAALADVERRGRPTRGGLPRSGIDATTTGSR